MTRLQKRMREELQRRNLSSDTMRGYLGAVEQFARYFGKPPDPFALHHLRQRHCPSAARAEVGGLHQW